MRTRGGPRTKETALEPQEPQDANTEQRNKKQRHAPKTAPSPPHDDDHHDQQQLDTPVQDAEKLSDYEKQREENIRQNNAILAELNLIGVAADVSAKSLKAAPTQRGIKREAAKPSKKPTDPPRRSLRTLKLAPADDFAGGIRSVATDGTVTLNNGTVVKVGEDVEEPEPVGPPPETIAVESVNLGEEEGPAADAEVLSHVLGAPKLKKTTRAPPCYAADVAQLTLAEEDVAKVTKSATVHMAFQPRADSLVIACADKQGHVSLWRVDCAEEHPSDGVHMFLPHRSYVSGLEWCERGDARVLTCSYDGSVRALRPARSEWHLVHHSEELEYSAFVTTDSEALWLGTNTGFATLFDPRAPKPQFKPIQFHDAKLNSLSLDKTRPHLLASASTDRTVRVWDVRKLASGGSKRELHTLGVGAASQSAYWAPDGSGRILATSRDSLLRVFDGAHSGKPEQSAAIRHNTCTGRWVVPFRAIWSPDASAIVIGDMSRRAEVYDARKGKKLVGLKNAELMTAIPSRNCCHPEHVVVAAATNSGRVHIYRK